MAKSMMDQDMLKVLYSEEQIRTRVQEMGDTLYEQFKDRNPLFLGVLKGSFIFMADIVRACQIKSDIEFIAVSSYQNGTSSSGAGERLRAGSAALRTWGWVMPISESSRREMVSRRVMTSAFLSRTFLARRRLKGRATWPMPQPYMSTRAPPCRAAQMVKR